MKRRWLATTTRALPALVVVGLCLGAVAYAATAPGGFSDVNERPQIRAKGPRPGSARPPRPLIVKRPQKMSTTASANFAFKVTPAGPRFQCRLDGAAWRPCRSPLLLSGLVPGDHSFWVRAVAKRGVRGASARFSWTLFEPKQFSIESQLSSIGALYPGAAPVLLPVVLRNPNPVPIRVTALRVAATADAPGCAAAANLELIPASASPSSPLTVAPGAALSLPAPGATPPAIALRDLPVNQDACQGASFPLAFSGEAHG